MREDAKALGAKARSQVEQTLARDDVQRVREDVHQIGEKARSQVEQTLARDEVQRVREDLDQIGAKARQAVAAAVQRPEAQELRRRVESAIEDVSERLRPAAAEDKKEPPRNPASRSDRRPRASARLAQQGETGRQTGQSGRLRRGEAMARHTCRA